jgi:hypothetical protein
MELQPFHIARNHDQRLPRMAAQRWGLCLRLEVTGRGRLLRTVRIPQLRLDDAQTSRPPEPFRGNNHTRPIVDIMEHLSAAVAGSWGSPDNARSRARHGQEQIGGSWPWCTTVAVARDRPGSDPHTAVSVVTARCAGTRLSGGAGDDRPLEHRGEFVVVGRGDQLVVVNGPTVQT